MNFEQALARLNEISAKMEDQNMPLEEALKLYSEASELVKICKEQIDSAKLTLEKVNGNNEK